MIKLKKLIKEVMDANQPPAHVQQATNAIANASFLNYIKSVENNSKAGFDKDKNLWFPSKSVEGGFPTIGYGHKIKDKKELEVLKRGISDEAVQKLLVKDIIDASQHVSEYIKRKYKVNLMLTEKQNEMLTDFAFNLGSLDKFPKFVDAVLRNNVEGMKQQYKRYTGGKELTGRNTAFYNRFLK